MHYSFRSIAAFSINARYLRHSTFVNARRHIFWQEPRRRDPFATLYWMQPRRDTTSDVLHCGKSGAEADVVVGVGARVVEVHVEDRFVIIRFFIRISAPLQYSPAYLFAKDIFVLTTRQCGLLEGLYLFTLYALPLSMVPMAFGSDDRCKRIPSFIPHS